MKELILLLKRHAAANRDLIVSEVKFSNATVCLLMQGQNHTVEKYVTLLSSLFNLSGHKLNYTIIMDKMPIALASSHLTIVVGFKNERTGEFTEMEALMERK